MAAHLRQTISILLYLFAWHVIQAQESFVIKHYTVKDGLAHAVSYALTSTASGMLWIGTDDGLCRFDGSGFKTYKHDDHNSNSLPSNVIRGLTEDQSGNLWIATSSGISRMDIKNQNFKNYFLEAAPDNRDLANRVRYIRTNKNGIVCAVAYKGFYVYDKSSDKFISFAPDDQNKYAISSNSINWKTLSADPITGDFYIGTDKGINYFNPIRNIFINYKNTSDQPDFYNTKGITGLCQDQQGKVWYAYEKDPALYCYDPKNGKVDIHTNTCLSFDKQQGVQNLMLFTDNHNRIWIGTNSIYIFCFDPSSGKWISLENQNNCRDIVQDFAGDIWLALDGATAKIHSPQIATNYWQTPDRETQFSDISSDQQGRIWLGTETKGLFQLTGNSHSLQVVKAIDKYAASKLVWVKEKLLLAGKSSITVWDTQREQLSASQALQNLKAGDINHWSASSNQDAVWISAQRGLLRYSSESNQIDSILPQVLKNEHIGLVQEESPQKLWLALSKSSYMIHLDLTKGVVEKVYSNPNDTNALNRAQINTIFQDSRHHIWIGTEAAGICLYKPETGIFSTYSDKNGLNYPYIKSITEDNYHNIWVLTSTNLERFDYQSNFFTVIDLEQPTPIYEFTKITANPQTGLVYLLAPSGLYAFDPVQTFNKSPHARITITDFKVFDKPFPIPANGEHIFLKHDQNFVSLNFVLPEFNKPTNIKYAYFMEGFDRDWNYTGNLHQAGYTNIPGGTYTLHIKATDASGVWLAEEYSIVITILLPWYNTWWFYILVLLVASSITYGLYRYRLRKIMEMQAMRNKIARDLHDDIGSTLGSISVYSEVIRNRLRKAGVEVADEVLDKIGDASRDMIEKMSDIVWSVNPGNDSFEHLVNRMRAFAAMMLPARNIQYHFEVEEALFGLKLSMEQRKNMFLILKEAIHNAAKYAQADMVNIKIEQKDKFLILTIRDNGKGFDPKTPRAYNGNGLKNMRFRAEEIKATLTIESELSKGSKISLKFKCV